MIYSVRGTLVLSEPYQAVVECGGVGFLVKTSLNTMSQLPPIGTEVLMYTHMNVREDAMELYGFADKNELAMFRMLVSVSGVGPKAAISILSGMTTERLSLCIASGDTKALKAPGVGQKTAQRIVLELKDKVSAEQAAEGFSVGAVADTRSGNAAEAISALEVLGYARSEATRVVSAMEAETPVEEMIKQGLRALSGK